MTKLCLGTVQFGMKYGVNNQIGRQPTWQESFEMLDYSLENGIDTIDTARAYGEAELVLGEYFKNRRDKKNNVKVISKLRPNVIDEGADIEKVIMDECKNTLLRLNIDKLNGYLLHTPEYIYNKEILSALQELKSKNYVDNIGVSIYDLKEGLEAIKTGVIDYIQLPYSVLDQRGSKADFFEKAKQERITVFTRSAFLQGLFMMDEDSIPKHLVDSVSYVKIFEKVRKKYGLSKAEALINFVKYEKNIDYIVFGVEKKEQLIEDINVYNKEIDVLDFVNEIKEKIDNVDKSIIFPSLWSNGKKAE